MDVFAGVVYKLDVALNKRLSQMELYNLDEDQYRDYMRAELRSARSKTAEPKRGIIDVLLTVVFFVGIVLIVLHQNGMIGK
jgi:hypothetical protein